MSLQPGVTKYGDLRLLWFRRGDQALVLFRRHGSDRWGRMAGSAESFYNAEVQSVTVEDMRRELDTIEAGEAGEGLLTVDEFLTGAVPWRTDKGDKEDA